MKRSSAIDLLGILRSVGYAIAIVSGLASIAVYLGAKAIPAIGLLGLTFVPWVMFGLVIAWVFALSRVLVARMRFQSERG